MSNPMICDLNVFIIHFNSNEIEALLGCSNTSCSTSHKRIKNDSVWGGDKSAQVFHQVHGLNSWVWVLHRDSVRRVAPVVDESFLTMKAAVVNALNISEVFKPCVPFLLARFSTVKESCVFVGE